MSIRILLIGILLVALGALFLWPAKTQTFQFNLADSDKFLTYECQELETDTLTAQNAEAAHQYFVTAVEDVAEQFGPQLNDAMASENP